MKLSSKSTNISVHKIALRFFLKIYKFQNSIYFMDSKTGIIFRKYDGEFLLCFLSSYFGRSSQNSKQSFITSPQLIQAHNKNQGRDSEGLSSM